MKLIEGKKNHGEEVTSPLKDVRPLKQGSGAAKAELFPKQVDGGGAWWCRLESTVRCT